MSEPELTSVEPEVQGVEPSAPVAPEGNLGATDATAEQIELVSSTETPSAKQEDSATTSAPSSDQKIYDGNPYIGNDRDYNEQKAAEERGHSLGNGGGDSRLNQEKEREEQKSQFLESHEQSQKSAERRKEWLECDHDFGGQKMSGHDLDKLIQMYANNPQMQDKLKDRLQKNGMSKDKADKAVNDFNDYMKILKKESEGKELSPEELRRKEELAKNEGVKIAAQILTDKQEMGTVVKVTNENYEQRLGKTQESASAAHSAAMGSNNNVSSSNKVALFSSYCENAVQADNRPRDEFNICSHGGPTVSIKGSDIKVAAALSVKEQSAGPSLSAI